MFEYDHLVRVDEKKCTLSIYRVHPDGSKHLFTEVDLPENFENKNIEVFEKFSKTLGENILIDSIIARKHFGLE